MATKEEVAVFFAEAFPQARIVIDAVGDRGATVSLGIDEIDLRPGGTVSGPALVSVADTALYVAILGEIGIIPQAVTTNMTINFLKRPDASRRVIGVCKLMRVGKVLAVGEVWLYSEGQVEPVAHVVGTYAIPPVSAK